MPISGRSAFLSLLQDEGIQYLFGNPGTTELPIMAALPDHPDLTYVLGLQEAIVVAMADGYSRASGQLSACNVHVAPGLGNAMGSLFNARWAGSPVIVTAGQQEQGHGLTEPMLYDPLIPIASPMVKWAVEVTRLEDLPRIVHRAAKVALTPPTGPVFLSLPGDILNSETEFDLGSPTRVSSVTRPDDETLDHLLSRIQKAKNPVILAGHELSLRDALSEAGAFAELLGIPVYQQTVPHSAQFLSEHPCFMGAFSRSQTQVKTILEAYDLLICFGADVLRMSVGSATEPLPDGMAVIQIGERDWELGKNYPAEIAVQANIKETLRALNTMLCKQQSEKDRSSVVDKVDAIRSRNWEAKRRKLQAETIKAADRSPIDPGLLMLKIAQAVPEDVVVVDEGLTASRSLLSFLPFRDSRGYYGLDSGGIGFAVAGTIGIHLAQPDRPLLAVIGDGSSLYNIQALWTAANMKLPITYVIANNSSYRILKDRVLEFHGQDQFVGMNMNDPAIDFVGLAQSFGLKSQRISHPDEITPAIQDALKDTTGPRLIDVSIDDGYSR